MSDLESNFWDLSLRMEVVPSSSGRKIQIQNRGAGGKRNLKLCLTSIPHWPTRSPLQKGQVQSPICPNYDV